MIKKFITLLFLLLLFIADRPSWADSINLNGNLIYNSGLAAFNGWIPTDNGTPLFITYNVSKTTDNPNWLYNYTFSSPNPKVSLAIIEVSLGFSRSDLELSDGSKVDKFEVGFFPNSGSPTGQENSTPGLDNLGEIYGAKFDFTNVGTEPLVWSFWSNRSPMWGDFYAKGSNTSYAYNTGFGVTNIDRYNLNLKPQQIGKIMVPNKTTTMVPEPATMLLLGFGLMGMAFIGRRKFRK